MVRFNLFALRGFRMHFRKIVTTAVLSGLLGAAGLVAGAAPASAAAPADCALGLACAWADQNYTGRVVKFENWIGSMSKHSFNDTATSVYNNGRTKDVLWWKDSQISGAWGFGESYRMKKQTGNKNLGNSTTGWNNAISAGNFEGTVK